MRTKLTFRYGVAVGICLWVPFWVSMNLLRPQGITAAIADSNKPKELSCQDLYASVMDTHFGARVDDPDPQLLKHLNGVVATRQRQVPTRNLVLQALYGVSRSEDVYNGFRFPEGHAARFPSESFKSNFYLEHADVFAMIESLLQTTKEGSNTNPIQFIVEAGSFVGTSALHWASFARKYGALVLCIDTWEGDVNMWVLPALRKAMSIEWGRAHLFDNFLQNMIDGNATDVVVPMAASSIVGAKVLWAQKFLVDVVYVDTAHEEGETLGELFTYWELLRPGGVLVGDDYNYFPAVKKDVDAFVAYKNAILHFTPIKRTFAIQKPLQ